jgi:hypothetical protein
VGLRRKNIDPQATAAHRISNTSAWLVRHLSAASDPPLPNIPLAALERLPRLVARLA